MKITANETMQTTYCKRFDKDVFMYYAKCNFFT